MVISIVVMQKGEKMAELTLPINVNLPDDWKEQILERIKQDGDWVCVIRCRECIHVGHDIFDRGAYCNRHKIDINDNDYCSYGRIREESAR